MVRSTIAAPVRQARRPRAFRPAAALLPALLTCLLAAWAAGGCASARGASSSPSASPSESSSPSRSATPSPGDSPSGSPSASPSASESPYQPAVGPGELRPASTQAPAEPPARPRGVVLMIGDGMGVSQITFARRLLLPPGERFRFETLPALGLVSTWSASNPVTDSGAGATAMATGVKTSNLYVGVDAQAQRVESITERAKERGWKVGYVTTTTVTHATPAAFYAHVPDRYADEDVIAEQLLEHRPDVVLGGGLGRFLPAEAGGSREDGRNLLAEARAAGYEIWRRGDLAARRGVRRDPRGIEAMLRRKLLEERRGRPIGQVGDQSMPVPAQLLGLFAEGHLAFQLDDRRRPPAERDPALAELVELALEALGEAQPGFFLVVEGGRIDHAGHNFDAAGLAPEIAAFDRAVAAVLEFRKAHPDVLVLVTADHATGGLALNDYVDWDELRSQRASVEWMATEIRESGAGADLVASMTGYTDITDADLDAVRDGELIYDASRALGRLLADRNGVTFVPRISDDTYGHTGEDVPIWAVGPGAERFDGVLDNTDVYHRLFSLLAW